MQRFSLPLLVVLLTPLAVAADSKPPSTEDQLAVNVKEANWAAPKNPEIPKGVMASPIATDPASGANIGYAKFAPGLTFPMHWHTHAEYTSVVSGKVQFTVNGKAYDLEPGGYVVIPGKVHHMAKCAAGAECVLLTRRAGPADYNWVK